MTLDRDGRVAAREFVAQFYPHIYEFEPVANDASARHYWRFQHEQQPLMLMDANHEGTRRFVAIDRWLYKRGVPVPQIFHEDPNDRFLILEDFGDKSLLKNLKSKPEITKLNGALEVIRSLSKLEQSALLEVATTESLLQEMQLLCDWGFQSEQIKVQPAELQPLFQAVVAGVMNQPLCAVHRDYHPLNIHVCANKAQGIGVIDFQDMLWSSYTYDLVSLLQDRYLFWSQAQVQTILEDYRRQTYPGVTSSQWREDYIYTSLQRHIRILGVFYRLSLRDQKPGYLQNYSPVFAEYCKDNIAQSSEFAQIGEPLLEYLYQAKLLKTK